MHARSRPSRTGECPGLFEVDGLDTRAGPRRQASSVPAFRECRPVTRLASGARSPGTPAPEPHCSPRPALRSEGAVRSACPSRPLAGGGGRRASRVGGEERLFTDSGSSQPLASPAAAGQLAKVCLVVPRCRSKRLARTTPRLAIGWRPRRGGILFSAERRARPMRRGAVGGTASTHENGVDLSDCRHHEEPD